MKENTPAPHDSRQLDQSVHSAEEQRPAGYAAAMAQRQKDCDVEHGDEVPHDKEAQPEKPKIGGAHIQTELDDQDEKEPILK